MENEKDTVDVQDEIQEDETSEEETQEEAQEEEESKESTEEDEENSTQLQSELEKQKAENAKLQRLLKKEQKKQSESQSESEGEQLPQKDLIALIKSNKVAEEDYDDFISLAKAKGQSVAEALKDDDLNAMLDARQERRKTAKASETGTTKRGSSKVSDEVLLANAKKGQIPESEKDMQRLIELQLK